MENGLKAWRRPLVQILVPSYLFLTFGLPALLTILLWRVTPYEFLQGAEIILAPFLYTFLFLSIAGLLSLPHQKGIINGKFPRDVAHPIYFHRRMYGLCWTSVYYFKPVYYLALTLPWLKRLTFRLFGYRGTLNFTIYPDTWIRDLPLLTFGDGVYVANRATLGTNLALRDGTTMVEAISIGAGTVIGHLCALAPGCIFGENCELGSMAGMGYRNKVGNNVDIGPASAIEHGVQIGDNVRIGATAYIGTASRIEEGCFVQGGAVLPPRSKVKKEKRLVPEIVTATSSV